MAEIAITLPVPPVVPESVATYRHAVVCLLSGHRVPAGTPVHVSARLYVAQPTLALAAAAALLLDALAAALGVTPGQVRELHLFCAEDLARPRADVRVLWHEDALPWHCAWCEPLPGQQATSGICDYHRAALTMGTGRQM